MAGVWPNLHLNARVAFSLCSMRSQLWQMQDRLGAAVLLRRLRLQALAVPALWGWAAWGGTEGCLIVCVFSEGGHSESSDAASALPPVFLALEERDAAEGVEQREGGGLVTRHDTQLVRVSQDPWRH